MYAITLISLLLLCITAQRDVNSNPPLTSSKTPSRNVSAVSRAQSVIIGSVAVRRASNGNIVVIVDKSLNATKMLPDGIPDLVYRFAPLKEDLTRYGDISFNLEQAQVFFQPGRLAVVTKNNQLVVSVSVEQIEKADPQFPIYGDQSRDLQHTVRFQQGIGLVRQVPTISDSSKSVNIGMTPKASKLPALIDMETEFVIRRSGTPSLDDVELEADACTAGGQGATSCSIDCPGGNGCSVTCGTGYWACCKCPNNCRCAEKN
ncbi:MAG TPA: hypothetical protein VGO96_06790 [Pyrinomonadaceae bacterium]|jgi:hypothetical protein|nr:hypothetical protein [Pyrinomonadaceae bacterium]